MKNRLMTGVTAAVMAVVIGVGGTAKPVKAAVPYVQIAIAVASALFSGGGGGGDLERAKREIIDAINSARQEIIGQIDSIASAEVRACTDAATTKVLLIDQLDPFSLSLFVNDAVNCATLSSAFFDAVQTPSAADTIGKLIGAIYSIALVGFTKLGFPTVDLLDRLIRSYDAVVVKLAPQCDEQRVVEYDDRGRPFYVEIQYTCTAYNGDKAYGLETYYRGQPGARLDRVAVQNEATRNTSRATAQLALPTLRSLRAGLG